MNTTVADLSAKHIGKRIRITSRDTVFTGRLANLAFETERTFGGAQPVAVEVTFDDATITYPLTASVEVLS